MDGELDVALLALPWDMRGVETKVLFEDQFCLACRKGTTRVNPEKYRFDRLAADKDKNGVFIGAYAINPVNQERIPIWIADYVLMAYGTGAIMAVPGHDQRDFEFAQLFELQALIARLHIVAENLQPRSGQLGVD